MVEDSHYIYNKVIALEYKELQDQYTVAGTIYWGKTSLQTGDFAWNVDLD